jgi:High potential iron-sulfur protein
MNNRRTFLLKLVATSSGLAAVRAHGQTAGPKLEESDPQAVALGYKQDTAKVDGSKFPKHDVSQTCATCQLFLGKPTDPAGACSLFAGKQVAASGWCSAWVKKAG